MLRNAFVPGSATSESLHNGWVNINSLSDEDNLNLMDRQRIEGTNLCVLLGNRLQHVFYPLQQAGLPTWTNNAWANYNALTITLRYRLANGFPPDFTYMVAFDRAILRAAELKYKRRNIAGRFQCERFRRIVGLRSAPQHHGGRSV